ncbi:MAG: hypothetical protein KDD48_04255 [Bdellovibrionales bacterium]|nr:hypothetical protein [Bdellovibrionales bacterium]
MLRKDFIILCMCLGLLSAACGIAPPSTECATTTCTNTNTNTSTTPTTPIANDQPVNLATFANITANNPYGRFYPSHVKDLLLGDTDNWHENFTWMVKDNIDQSWINLEWATPAVINRISLYDSPTLAHQITSGEIVFTASDGSYISPRSFSSLSNNGYEALTVEGPGTSKAVKSIKIKILNHIGDRAGLNEIVVEGYRIQDTAMNVSSSTNLAHHARVIAASSVKNEILDSTGGSTLSGLYSARYAIDNNTQTRWKAINGDSSSLTFEFDLPYCVSKITLYDLDQSGESRFSKAKLILDDSVSFEASKTFSSGQLSINVNQSMISEVKTIRVELIETNGAEVGLKNIDIKACPGT